MSIENIFVNDIRPWKNIYINEINDNKFPQTQAPANSILYAPTLGNLDWLGFTGSTGPILNNPASYVIYQPGGTGSYPYLSDWNDVVSYVNTNQGLIDIYFDDTFGVCNISAGLNCQNRTRFISYKNNSGSSQVNITVSAGEVLTNPYMFIGPLTLTSSNADVCIGYSDIGNDNPTLILYNNVTFINDVASSTYLITLNTNITLNIYTYSNCTFTNNSTSAMIAISNGSHIKLYAYESCSFPNSFIEGFDITTSVLYFNDSSCNNFTLPGFPGVFAINNQDNSNKVVYNDLNATPAYGSTNVQGALDATKTINKQYLSVQALNPTICGSGASTTILFDLQSQLFGSDISFNTGTGVATINSHGIYIISYALNYNEPAIDGLRMFFISRNNASTPNINTFGLNATYVQQSTVFGDGIFVTGTGMVELLPTDTIRIICRNGVPATNITVCTTTGCLYEITKLISL